MAPPPVDFIARISCFIESHRPVTLTSKTRPNAAASISSTVPASTMPAAFTAMCSGPARSTRELTDASSVTSAVTERASPPASRIMPTVSSSSDNRRPATTALAPALAKANAMLLPMPLPAPVTRTVLPENSKFDMDHLFLC
ncbi:hypothetical protein D3C71_1399500 [compost metagenome]